MMSRDRMIARRNVLVAAGGAWVAWPLVSAAQQTGRVWRIGFLSLLSVQASAPYQKAFEEGLRERGYVIDQNITIIYRRASGRLEDLPKLAADLVRLKVDVIVAGAPAATNAAIEATATIPIVFIAVADPVARGFVTRLARPGKNVTGLSGDVGSLITGKQLELLKEIAPSISRVAVLRARELRGPAPWEAELEIAGRALDLRPEPFENKTAEDLEATFRGILRQRPDALFVSPETLNFLQRKRIADFAADHRLPAIFPWREAAEDGGLIAYGTAVKDLARRAATYVDKILKGANPGDLPVEQPTKFELVVNLKTAKAIGLTVLQSILVRADEVIE